MNQSMPRIATVGAIGAGVIKVKWRDRTSDRVDLSGWIATGGEVLARLLNREVFKSPRVSEYGSSVAWGSDDDLRIDAVHLEPELDILAHREPVEECIGLKDHAAILAGTRDLPIIEIDGA